MSKYSATRRDRGEVANRRQLLCSQRSLLVAPNTNHYYPLAAKRPCVVIVVSGVTSNNVLTCQFFENTHLPQSSSQPFTLRLLSLTTGHHGLHPPGSSSEVERVQVLFGGQVARFEICNEAILHECRHSFLPYVDGVSLACLFTPCYTIGSHRTLPGRYVCEIEQSYVE